jgi:hypothetical protein
MLAFFLRNYKRIRENERKRDRGHKVNKSLRPKLLSVLFFYSRVQAVLYHNLSAEGYPLLIVCFNYMLICIQDQEYRSKKKNLQLVNGFEYLPTILRGE